MDLATKILEDQPFIEILLEKSHRAILQARLFAEALFTQAGIKFERKGCV
jgi:hypothetical protein